MVRYLQLLPMWSLYYWSNERTWGSWKNGIKTHDGLNLHLEHSGLTRTGSVGYLLVTSGVTAIQGSYAGWQSRLQCQKDSQNLTFLLMIRLAYRQLMVQFQNFHHVLFFNVSAYLCYCWWRNLSDQTQAFSGEDGVRPHFITCFSLEFSSIMRSLHTRKHWSPFQQWSMCLPFPQNCHAKQVSVSGAGVYLN